MLIFASYRLIFIADRKRIQSAEVDLIKKKKFL